MTDLTITADPEADNACLDAAPGADGKPETKTVSLKDMPVEAWDRMQRHARADGVSNATWIAGAIARQAEWQDSNKVFPPGKQVYPAVAPDAEPPAPPVLSIDLAGFGAALAATTAAYQAAEIKPPAAMARDAGKMLRDTIRQARGLPARKTARKTGQTLLIGDAS